MLGAIPLGFIGGDSSYDTSRSSRSAWFDGAADYLAWTPAGAANSLKTGTIVFAVQRTSFGSYQHILSSCGTSDGNNEERIEFNSSDQLVWSNTVSGTYRGVVTTNAVFRDLVWYIIAIVKDLANGQLDIYINGQLASVTVGTAVQDYDGYIGKQSADHKIGRLPRAASQYFNGSLAQLVFIDGTEHSISDLVEEITYGTNGVGASVKYDAEYEALASAAGGNSFALTSVIGDGSDSSGLANNFTPTSMSDAANGSDNTPSLQYSILSPLDLSAATMTISEGGRKAEPSSLGFRHARLSMPLVGKQYWEVQLLGSSSGSPSSRHAVGVMDKNFNEIYDAGTTPAQNVGGAWVANGTGETFAEGVAGTTYTALSINDHWCFAFNAASGDLWIRDDGAAWWGGGDPAAGTSPTLSGITTDSPVWPLVSASQAGDIVLFKMTESEWTQSAPSDFLASNSANNGRTATDPQGCDWFNVLLWTGNDTTNVQSGAGFQADLLVGKGRSLNEKPTWIDSVRGVGEHLFSSTTGAELSAAGLASFDSDGITLEGGIGSGVLNANTYTYAGWLWCAGGTGVSNNNGTIASTVSVAEPGHFSIVSYTGNGVAGATFGHGMPGSPDLLICKNRDFARNWMVFAPDILGVGSSDYLMLDQTGAEGFAGATNSLNNTAPSSTLITLGDEANTNENTKNFIYYLFRSVPGVLKINLRTGNGDANGPLSPADFRPKSSITKRIDSANSWVIQNAAINPFNPVTNYLQLESTSTETTSSGDVDYLPNGMKIRNSGPAWNASGGLYLDILFADIAGGGELAPLLGR